MTPEEFLRWASRFPDALMLAAGDGEILALNPALLEVLGPDRDPLVGTNLRDWAPGASESVGKALRLWSGSGRMISGPGPFQLAGLGPLRCEGAVVRAAAAGARAVLVVRIRRQQAAAGRFLELNQKLDELNKEVRARKVSEAAIDRQREWLHVTLSSIGDAVIATDLEGRVEFLNSVAEQLTGWTVAEATGKPVTEIFQILDERTRQPVASPALEALEKRAVVALGNHTLLRDRAGSERPIEDSAAPIRGTNGVVVGAVVVFHDVSKQYEARAALERARDEALAASRAKDDFLAALSHELRTPLNPALLLASQAAADPALPAEIRTDFRTIEKQILLEARLIDDLLDLTRIARGKMSLNFEPVELAETIKDSVATVRPEILEKDLAMVLELEAADHRVLGDRTRLQQVIWNVLKNAVKFTPPGGRLGLATRNEEPRTVTLEFTDTGAGMTPAELSRLFVPFSQGEPEGRPAVHRFGGLGLGLAISKVIVELHQGRIEASSPGPGKGATIRVVLPLLPARKGPADLPGAAAQPGGRPGHDGQGRRLLLVEDHEPTRRTIARLLAARKYDVVTAASVASALELAEETPFDLVISDIGLPDGDGRTLMRLLHERYQLKGIAVSGYGMEHDLSRSAEAGCMAHLTKPVTVRAMEAALTQFWEQTPDAAGSSLTGRTPAG